MPVPKKKLMAVKKISLSHNLFFFFSGKNINIVKHVFSFQISFFFSVCWLPLNLPNVTHRLTRQLQSNGKEGGTEMVFVISNFPPSARCPNGPEPETLPCFAAPPFEAQCVQGCV